MESNQGQEEIQLSPEQRDHFEGLASYLVSTHNVLASGVVEVLTDGEQGEVLGYVVGAEALSSVLDSLHTTANNFADLLGLEINESPIGEEVLEEESGYKE